MILFAPLLVAASTPDYLGYMERLEPYAELVTSVASCRNMGFVFDDKKGVAVGERLIADAIKDGIDRDTAMRLLDSAVEEEKSDMAYLADKVDADNGEAVEEFLDYWEARCLNVFRNYHEDGTVSYGG